MEVVPFFVLSKQTGHLQSNRADLVLQVGQSSIQKVSPGSQNLSVFRVLKPDRRGSVTSGCSCGNRS